jgi:hypothetical protein
MLRCAHAHCCLAAAVASVPTPQITPLCPSTTIIPPLPFAASIGAHNLSPLHITGGLVGL